MAVRRVQLRRGNTAENNAFTGAVGELTVDTQTVSVRVHDGTAGGKDLMRADMSNNASITSNIGVTGSITIGPALGANTITLGQAASTIDIPGTLNVATQNTTANLNVNDKIIALAYTTNNQNTISHNVNSIGLVFYRPDGANVGGGQQSVPQNNVSFYWDEGDNHFTLASANGLTSTTDDISGQGGFSYENLYLGTLYAQSGVDVNDGNITNVGDIALDSISADGNTIGMTLKQAGLGAAFTIVDNDANGANTFLTIDATDGADKLTISTTSFEVSSTTVFNEAGADVDFRVEGTGKANALFVQGSDGFVGINKGVPTKQLDVVGDVAISTTLDVAGKSTLTGSLDLTTASSDGITFRSEIAADGADADATLLRVNIGGAGPTYKTLSWDADTDRFTFDTDAQILNGGLVLGDGTNATTISVVDQSGGGNTLGEHLTISAGKGQGTEAGGSIIFQTQSAAGGALTTVLTLDKDNLATFTGNIDFSDGAILGGSVGNTHTLTLGGHVGSTTNVAGILQVTGNTIKSSGATAITLSSDDVTVIGGLSITGTDNKKVNLGATDDGTAFEIAMQPRVAGGVNDLAGANLTITAGQSVGNANGGSIIFRTSEKDTAGVGGAGNGLNALQTVLTLDTAKLATFGGNIDFSDGTILGASVGDTHTLTLGGHTGSTTTIAGKLLLGANSIQASDGGNTISINPANDLVTFLTNIKLGGDVIVSSNNDNTITLSEDDATILGGLTITGTGITPSNANLGGAGQLVIGAGAGADSHLTATHRVAGGNNDLASGNFIISAGKSVGQGAGGSIVFQTSESDSAGVGAGNGLNDLQTVLTLDNAKLATFAGNVVVEGREIKLGTATGGATKIEVEGQTAANTAGHELTISAGVGKGSGAGGSIVFQTASAGVADGGQGTLADALEIFHDKRSYFSGNIDFGNNTVLGGSVGNTHTLTLGGDVGSTTNVAGILQVTSNTIKSSGATAITLSNDDATVVGGLTITGTGITPSAAGLGGAGQLVIGAGAGADSHLTATHSIGGGANDIASGNFIISAGKSVGAGAGGSIVFQTSTSGAGNQTVNALQTVLTLDNAKKATFAGNIDFSNGTILGSSVGAGHTLTLGGSTTSTTNVSGYLTITGTGASALNFTDADVTIGNAVATAGRTITLGGSTTMITKTAGILTVGGDSIKSSTAEAITLSADDVTVVGDLNITGASSQKVNLGATNDGTAFEIAMQPRVAGGLNDLAGANLTITAGRSVGNANGGSIIFRTSEKDTAGVGGAGNVLNALQTVLTLDTTKKATFAGNVLISGNLEVDGTTTQIDSTISTYVDPMILLNKNDLADTDTGVFMGREATDGHNVAMYWDHGESSFAFASTSADASDTTVAVDLSAQANYALQPVKALSIGMGTTDTTASNTIQTRNANAFVVKDNTDGANTGNNLVVNTASGQIETRKIIPLANDTYDIGASGTSFATGYFTSLDTTSDVQFDGTVNLGTNADNQDKDITVVARSGGADLVGNDLTITAGRSTGTGAGGSLKFVTSATGGASNAVANTLQTVLTLDTNQLATFSGAIHLDGNEIQNSNGTNAIALTADNSTTTISATTTKTSGDLTVEGRDITLGTAGGGDTTIAVPTSAGAGHALTISSGLGSNAGVNDGSLILRSGSTPVLTLDTAELATFAGNIKVGTNVIQSSGGQSTITLSGKDATVLGGLTITGTDITPSAAGLGGAGQLVIGAGAGADSHLTATHRVAGGDNDLASGNFIISAGKSVGEGAGGSIVFQTSESDTAGVGGAGNGLNDLQTVLTLDNAKLATFAGAIDVTTTSILRGNTSLYSGADLFVYSDAGTTAKFTVDGATGDTSIVGTLGVTGITTLDDTLKIKSGPTGSNALTINSDRTDVAKGGANTDVNIIFVEGGDNGTDAYLKWDDSEDSFVISGGELHSETQFGIGGTPANPNFKVDTSGNITFKGTLSSSTSLNQAHVSFKDRILFLGANNSNQNDLGFYGLYQDGNGSSYYTGLMYQPESTAGGANGVYKLFHTNQTIAGSDDVNVTVSDTQLSILDISELRGGSALGNNDTAGANLTISGGKSTGSATGGGIVFKTGGSGAGAAVENAPTTALTIDNAQKTTLNVAGAGLDITKTTGLTGDEQTNNAPLFSTNTRAFQVTMTTHTAIADDAHSIGFLVNNTSVSSSSVIMATVASATNGGDILTEAGIEVYAHSLTNGTSFEFSLVNRTGSEIATDSAIVINFVIL